jgi:glutathione S-transferase
MKLYYSAGACSLAPHIVLTETKQPFELIKVNTNTHQTADGSDYYAINPKGAVPLLELDSGERLSEGTVIVQYLCDKAGRTDLMPAPGTIARYRVMEWQNYITSELHKSFSPLFNAAFDATAKALFVAALVKKFSWVSSQLENKSFLTGDQFTGADAYLFTVTRWSKYVNVDISNLAALQAFMRRVAALPAVQATFKAEGITEV